MTETQMMQKRLPRYRRMPEQFGPLELTRRDHQVLELIGRYRYVVIDHVAALVGGSRRQLARRLQGMFHHGYLARHVRFRRLRTGLDLGSEKIAYSLDTKGWRALESRRHELEEALGGAVEPLVWRQEYTRRGELFIEHQLGVADFRATVEAALKGRGDLELLTWRQDHKLQHSFRYRDADKGEIVNAGVRPDAFFAVSVSGRTFPFFLEIDQGTEDHSRLAEKFQHLYEYARTERYRVRFEEWNPELMRILFVAKATNKRVRRPDESEPLTRLERMLRTLEGIRGRRADLRRLFWFARQDALALSQPETILGRVWRRRGMGPDDALLSLFGPLE